MDYFGHFSKTILVTKTFKILFKRIVLSKIFILLLRFRHRRRRLKRKLENIVTPLIHVSSKPLSLSLSLYVVVDYVSFQFFQKSIMDDSWTYVNVEWMRLITNCLRVCGKGKWMRKFSIFDLGFEWDIKSI